MPGDGRKGRTRGEGRPGRRLRAAHAPRAFPPSSATSAPDLRRLVGPTSPAPTGVAARRQPVSSSATVWSKLDGALRRVPGPTDKADPCAVEIVRSTSSGADLIAAGVAVCACSVSPLGHQLMHTDREPPSHGSSRQHLSVLELEYLGSHLEVGVVVHDRHPALSRQYRRHQIDAAHRSVPPRASQEALRIECPLPVAVVSGRDIVDVGARSRPAEVLPAAAGGPGEAVVVRTGRSDVRCRPLAVGRREHLDHACGGESAQPVPHHPDAPDPSLGE